MSESEPTEAQKALREHAKFAAGALEDGVEQTAVVGHLTERGMNRDQAEALVDRIHGAFDEDDERKGKKAAGLQYLLIGAALLAFGGWLMYGALADPDGMERFIAGVSVTVSACVAGSWGFARLVTA